MQNLPQEVVDLVNNTLEVKARIDELKTGRLAQLEATFDMYIDRIKSEMRKLGKKDFETDQGSVKWTDVSGRKSLDEEAVCKALGVETLDGFKTRGESSVRINVKFKHQGNQIEDNLNAE